MAGRMATRAHGGQVQTLPPCSVMLAMLNLGKSKNKRQIKHQDGHHHKSEAESVLQGERMVPGAPETTAEIEQEKQAGGMGEDEENRAFYRRVQEYADNAMGDGEEHVQGVFDDDETEITTDSAPSLSDIETDILNQDEDENETRRHLNMTEEEKTRKLRDVCEEFGNLDYLDTPEQYLWDIPAVLFTGVIIKGTFILTTHRLAFYAVLPNLEDNVSTRKYPITSIATIHFNSATKPKLRAYVVIREDGLTCYNDAKHLHDPAGSIHFSNIVEVHNAVVPGPVNDPRYVTFFFIQRMKGKRQKTLARIECDDEETATHFRNEIALAWFTYNNQMDRLRLSIPLDRVNAVETFDFIGHATNYAIQADESTPGQTGSEAKAHTVNISCLQSYDWVRDALKEQLLKIRGQVPNGPVSPQPIIEIRPARSSVTASWDARKEDEKEEESEDESDNENEDGEGWSPQKWVPDNDTKERFAFAFGLRVEDILYVFRGTLSRGIPTVGKIAITRNGICFLRKSAIANRVQLIVKKDELKDAQPYSSLMMKTYGFRLIIQGHPDISFHTFGKRTRNWAVQEIKNLINQPDPKQDSLLVASSRHVTDELDSRKSQDPSARSPLEDWQQADATLPKIHPSRLSRLPPMVNSTRKLERVALNFCCLTIGSRGDVQPYIAICKGLQKEGHKTCIATHPEYKEWVESYNIEHRSVGGDPAILMEISVQHKIFNLETINEFRSWFDDLLQDSYKAVKGKDVLIESPSTFAGVHIAEALQISYFRAFTMPWTRTGDYPHPFMTTGADLTRAYNYSSYLLFDQIMWRASSSQINKWRKNTLGLPSTDQEHLHIRKIPFIYNFSEAIVPRPMDWPSWVTVSGYWFLETSKEEWDPPQQLLDFIEKAKTDKKALVYCGFGSITIEDPNQLTQDVIAAVKKADVRMILSKGWSSRGSGGKSETVSIPEEIHQVDSIPRVYTVQTIQCSDGQMTGFSTRWLLQCTMAKGAGTTAASLRAGCPTLIKPFFGDQNFWAQRVHKLGAGLKVKSLGADDMAEAFTTAVKDRVMKEKADIVGKQLRNEDGVQAAIQFIYTYFEKAANERSHKSEKSEKSEKAQTIATGAIPLASPTGSTLTKQDTRSSVSEPIDGLIEGAKRPQILLAARNSEIQEVEA